MCFKTKSILPALFLATLNPIVAHAVTAPVIADSHVAAINAGSSPAINIESGSNGLMRFDLFALPENVTSADIGKATLVFYVKNIKTVGKLQLSWVEQPWKENTVTTSLAPQVGAPTVENPEILLANNYVTVDVTEWLQRWVDNPDQNNGLQLAALPGSGTAVSLDSKEAIQTSHAAYIDIVLNGPAGPKGEKGDTGATGARGAVGPQGPQGLNGSIGPQGPQGPQGDAGQTGISGYQIVQVNGTVASSFSPIGLIASCPSPKRVIGGGCRVNNFNTQAVSGFPSASTFHCSFKTSGLNEGVQSFAICANVN